MNDALTPDQIERIEDFQPDTPQDHRAKVVVLLCLDGLTMNQIVRLGLSDFNLELGVVGTDSALVPLKPSTYRAVADWLEVRPQRGEDQSLLTGLVSGKSIKNLPGEIGRFLKGLGIDATLWDLYATAAPEEGGVAIIFDEPERRFTQQRRDLLELLIEYGDDLVDAQEIHEIAKERGFNISLATVYRTLELFGELGIIQTRLDRKSLEEFAKGASRKDTRAS